MISAFEQAVIASLWRLRPVIVSIACLSLSCSSQISRRVYQFQGEALGTYYTVKIIGDEGARLAQTQQAAISDEVEQVLQDINNTMSTYAGTSELSRFNRSNSTAPQRMSPDMIKVFALAQRIGQESDGAFDITVGPLVNAWGFGPDARTSEGPPDKRLAELRECIGYRLIEVDAEAGTVRKTRPCVSCDLAAIAKGFAVDKVAERLEKLGCARFMVEVGGEVRTKGLNADGVPWRIAIEKPLVDRRAIHRVIGLTNAAMATSGDYRNFYEKDGRRLSHTIDPRTGRPVAHNLASVTVIHESCAAADAYATALMALGPEEGYRLAERLGLAALFITREPDGTLVEKTAPAFMKML